MPQNLSSRRYRNENGQSLVETAITLSLLILMLAAAVDFGRAFYMEIEVKGAARSGATYGTQSPGDTTGMQSAANLAAGDLSSDANWKVASSWGCECYSGSTPTIPGSDSCTAPSCASNIVDYVVVTASDTYSPLLPWPGIPSTLPMSATVVMRAGQ